MFKLTTKQEIDGNAAALPGVYKIYWLKDGKPQTIQRLIGEDETGLLYIGQTDDTLNNRLNQFRNSAFANSTNHPAGLKYRMNEAIRRLIARDDLHAEVFPCQNSTDKERDEIGAYVQKFGELPPLNG